MFKLFSYWPHDLWASNIHPWFWRHFHLIPILVIEKDISVSLLARLTCLPSVQMGDKLDYSNLSKSSKPGSVVTGKNAYNKSLIASRPKCFALRYHQHLVSLVRGDFGSSPVGRITFFVLKVAALEIVRRFSRSKCPCVWRGLQALQILCYPPFKWIQRWAPFKGLVKSMQVCNSKFLNFSSKIYLRHLNGAKT